MNQILRLVLLPVGLCLSAAGAASIPEEPRVFAGPLHFCGLNFAIDVAADERATWQQGPDFILYTLQSARGGFGVYEGNHPDIFENSREQLTVDGRRIERLRASNGAYSYLIEIPESRIQMVVHLYGQVWRGDESDLRLMSRVLIGSPSETGCNRPTAQQ